MFAQFHTHPVVMIGLPAPASITTPTGDHCGCFFPAVLLLSQHQSARAGAPSPGVLAPSSADMSVRQPSPGFVVDSAGAGACHYAQLAVPAARATTHGAG